MWSIRWFQYNPKCRSKAFNSNVVTSEIETSWEGAIMGTWLKRLVNVMLLALWYYLAITILVHVMYNVVLSCCQRQCSDSSTRDPIVKFQVFRTWCKPRSLPLNHIHRALPWYWNLIYQGESQRAARWALWIANVLLKSWVLHATYMLEWHWLPPNL